MKTNIEKNTNTDEYIDDIQFFIETNQDDPDFLIEILESFPDDVKDRLNKLKTSVVNENTKAIAVAAHKFIALFSCIFIDSASQISHKLQISAKSNNIDECHEIFNQLERLMNDIVHYLSSLKLENIKHV